MTEMEYREKNKAACANNYQKNKERRKSWQHEYYIAHREEILMKQKLHRMGLLQRNDRRGNPGKGAESKADQIKQLDVALYERRLAEYEGVKKQRHLQRMAEKLRQAGYTVTEMKEEEA